MRRNDNKSTGKQPRNSTRDRLGRGTRRRGELTAFAGAGKLVLIPDRGGESVRKGPRRAVNWQWLMQKVVSPDT